MWRKAHYCFTRSHIVDRSYWATRTIVVYVLTFQDHYYLSAGGPLHKQVLRILQAKRNQLANIYYLSCSNKPYPKKYTSILVPPPPRVGICQHLVPGPPFQRESTSGSLTPTPAPRTTPTAQRTRLSLRHVGFFPCSGIPTRTLTITFWFIIVVVRYDK